MSRLRTNNNATSEQLNYEKETPAVNAEQKSSSPSLDSGLLPLRLFLQFVGLVTLLAFPAAMMPEKWMVEIAKLLGIHSFPAAPLTFYLARHLSILYGFVGIGLLVLARDLVRYRPLVRYLAVGTIAFGVAQFVVDSMAGMPSWWTWGESISTVAGGGLLVWLNRAGSSGGRPIQDA
ncbi:signal peptide protein [Rhodopirellula maiorica SM1]|uniref:Signal peptide protein n=1 Tax=Rhodopirellula maiorica SM1 TaxID=1265738 RepID=M5RBQ1_9BACT|nr:hypothetical protein [Rhodopirellula maiorica]EMI16913.1 signal peptide protein [Rhodopirellula maiorica SM1]